MMINPKIVGDFFVSSHGDVLCVNLESMNKLNGLNKSNTNATLWKKKDGIYENARRMGITIGIETGVATSYAGRVNPLGKGYYPAHRNFKNQFKGHPSSTGFDNEEWDYARERSLILKYIV